jgi:hypothetical protein
MLALLGGPFGTIFSWFSSAFGKVIAVLGALAIITTLATTVYFSWKGSIEAASELRAQTQRQAELIRDKNQEIQNLKNLDALKARTLKDFQESSKGDNLLSDSVLAWLAQQNKDPKVEEPESSQILKDTFLKLYGK